MMAPFLIVFALIGATLIVVRSTLFAPIRPVWPKLLGCGQCTGFWVGALAGAAGIAQIGHGRVIDAIIVGAATSILALLTDGVLYRLFGDPDAPDAPDEGSGS